MVPLVLKKNKTIKNKPKRKEKKLSKIAEKKITKRINRMLNRQSKRLNLIRSKPIQKLKKKKRKQVKKYKYTEYQEYLRSEHWKKRRKEYWKTHKSYCFCCNGYATELHHNNYSRLGKEKDEDLVPICRNCHEECHNLIINNEDIKLKNAHIVRKQLLGLEN